MTGAHRPPARQGPPTGPILLPRSNGASAYRPKGVATTAHPAIPRPVPEQSDTPGGYGPAALTPDSTQLPRKPKSHASGQRSFAVTWPVASVLIALLIFVLCVLIAFAGGPADAAVLAAIAIVIGGVVGLVAALMTPFRRKK